jgi:transcriptional regulator with XRE-family HTH domain
MEGGVYMNLNITKFKIALARKSMNISDLSSASGVSSNTINSWLKNSGKRNPTTKALGKVAKALDIDVTELIEE